MKVDHRALSSTSAAFADDTLGRELLLREEAIERIADHHEPHELNQQSCQQEDQASVAFDALSER